MSCRYTFQIDFAGPPPSPQAVFAAIWEKIGSLTKSSVTFHLGQLAKVMEREEDDSKINVLEVIKFILHLSMTYAEMTPFVSMLRDAPIGTILEIKALAKKLKREDSDSMSYSTTGSENHDIDMLDVFVTK